MNIDVVTVCRNSEEYIGRCLDSIRENKQFIGKYIVVDGGSTDSTINIIKSYFDVIDEFISESDDGISDAFNKGIVRCTGDFILLLNSDDYLLPNAISDLIMELKDNDEVVTTLMRYVSRNGREALGMSCPSEMSKYNSIYHPGTLVARCVYQRVGLYDVSYRLAMDYEFFSRCIKCGIQFRSVDCVLVSFTVGGISRRRFIRVLFESYSVRRKYFNALFPYQEIKKLVRRLLGGLLGSVLFVKKATYKITQCVFKTRPMVNSHLVERRMSFRRVCLVGAFPPPFGGVTEHVYRLVANFSDLIVQVIDLHSSDEKQIPEGWCGLVCSAPRARVIKPVYLLYQLLTSSVSVVHFNFSTALSLVMLALIPKRKVRWILTLHHGDLFAKYYSASRAIRFFIKQQMRRFDSVVVLSDNQENFYRFIGLHKSVLDRLPSYLPLCGHFDFDLPQDFADFRQRNDLIILASGYPLRYYCYDYLLRYASDSVNNSTRVGVVIAVYGDGDWDWVESLVESSVGLPLEFLFVRNAGRVPFLNMLLKSDVYVRPSLVDSYGIAVADAVNAGLAVIASDVCDRYPGTRLFPVGDERAFLCLLDNVVTSLSLSTTKKKYTQISSEWQSYNDLYIKGTSKN
ncbi:glycosyltransferase [Prosthecochloris sp. CIB 2401]|uniref:glycosyltransferase n=1 Tax=Prosthecochloris sp. CIB 2401 TaxID=1868325 RepID=UPI00080A9ED6|nr:glycosyltransferase [Prosthecochloris sp. CIB 2401]ANT64628.1 PGL/p-HBAD biosynthesis glycosyltransferase protein [Prosthecochloris sp. CIB 2401]